jgi:MoaA/NifB/PqqE/SkfB family radical SAM enzyme
LKNIPDAKLSDVKQNLNDLAKMGIQFIDIIGGEPLLHKKLPEILSYAKELGFFVKLSTNGILYEERAHEIKDLPSRIYFSLDTISGKNYEKIRGIDGLHQLLSSIKLAKKMNQDICLICTITNENVTNIKEMANFAKENKVMMFLHPCYSYFGNTQLEREYIKEIKKYFWHPYIRMSLTDLDFFYKGGNDITNTRCLAGKSTIDISPDNHLLIPCFHKYKKKIKIKNNLYSLFQSDEWNSYHMKAGHYEFCNGCSIDCYFGLSYWDKIRNGFFKANLTQLKNYIEFFRQS